MKIRNLIPILAASAAFVSSAMAGDAVRHNREAASQGDFAGQASAARPINLDAGAHSVTVSAGETVRFTRGGRQFTYRFDGQGGAPFEVPLSRIAPAGFDSGDVRVYVNPDARDLPIG